MFNIEGLAPDFEISQNLSAFKEMNSKLIFLMESDAELCEVMESFIRSSGFEVKTFAQSEQLVGSLAERKPDHLVLDLSTPAEERLQLIHQIRALDSRLPISLMTIENPRKFQEPLKDYAEITLIQKPFELESFRIALQSSSFST